MAASPSPAWAQLSCHLHWPPALCPAEFRCWTPSPGIVDVEVYFSQCLNQTGLAEEISGSLDFLGAFT